MLIIAIGPALSNNHHYYHIFQQVVYVQHVYTLRHDDRLRIINQNREKCACNGVTNARFSVARACENAS